MEDTPSYIPVSDPTWTRCVLSNGHGRVLVKHVFFKVGFSAPDPNDRSDFSRSVQSIEIDWSND